MILEKRLEGNVTIYKVRKIMTDEQIAAKEAKFFSEKAFPHIVDHNADVYTEDGQLLLRFRKNVLPLRNIDAAYEALIQFAKQKVTSRGNASGSKIKVVGMNNEVMSNVIGYFDKYSIFEKHMFLKTKIPKKYKVRITSFTRQYPDKWARVVPLIQDIDRQYRKLVPKEYRAQKAAADQTAYRIDGTAFSTVTTNVNFRTALHKDAGDFTEGFGNLVVIERGEYEGAYTGFPQYGVAVDVRTGDFLAMDVHQYHANTKLRLKSPDTIRMSLVSYLRQALYEKTKGTTREHLRKNLAYYERVVKAYGVLKAAGIHRD